MIAAGIDVGSAAAKCCIFDAARREILGHAIRPTGWNALEAGESVLADACIKAGVSRSGIARIVGTGYGRVSLPFADKTVTEITCHARGASFLFPETDVVIDIGGQDSKVIKLGPGHGPGGVERRGGQVRSVQDFVMNDKCAAGTGRFLQVLSGILGMTLDELSEAAGRGAPVSISSMCAVFAETEIVGLLASGTRPEDVAAGVYVSIVRRVCALAKRIPVRGQCTFAGGLAQSGSFSAMLSRELGIAVNVPEIPQAMGALGAALIAADLPCA